MNRCESLIVYDIENWAYHRRAEALNARLDIAVEICKWASVPWARICEYDLVFLLDYVATVSMHAAINRAIKRPVLVISWNADSHRRQPTWNALAGKADWVVCVSGDRYEHRGQLSTCCHISNGVDTETFRSIVPVSKRPNLMLWCGQPKPGKGFNEVIDPLANQAGEFDFDFPMIGDHCPRLGAAAMARWYNSGRYILCASSSEGTANTVLEGAACGCVPVTTDVGNVREWAEHGKSAWIAAQSVEAFVEGLRYCRENLETMSAACVAAMQSWDYAIRAQYHYRLWRRLVNDGVLAVNTFSYLNVKPEEI